MTYIKAGYGDCEPPDDPIGPTCPECGSDLREEWKPVTGSVYFCDECNDVDDIDSDHGIWSESDLKTIEVEKNDQTRIQRA